MCHCLCVCVCEFGCGCEGGRGCGCGRGWVSFYIFYTTFLSFKVFDCRNDIIVYNNTLIIQLIKINFLEGMFLSFINFYYHFYLSRIENMKEGLLKHLFVDFFCFTQVFLLFLAVTRKTKFL